MFQKVMLSTLGLVAAAMAPIAFFSVSDYWKGQRPAATAKTTAGQTAAAGKSATADLPPALAAPERRRSKTWLKSSASTLPRSGFMWRWPRVSTGLDQLQLQGFRVPLVTGAAETDLAGSLTYYFNAQQQPQRIVFHGNSGDPSHLVALVSDRYHLARRQVNEPALTIYEAVGPDGQIKSMLRIQTAAVVRANEPQRRSTCNWCWSGR